MSGRGAPSEGRLEGERYRPAGACWLPHAEEETASLSTSPAHCTPLRIFSPSPLTVPQRRQHGYIATELGSGKWKDTFRRSRASLRPRRD